MNPDAPTDEPPPFGLDERETLLGYLDWKRAAVLRTAEGLSDEQARWTPEGRLLPIAGIINHLTHVEARWIDGRLLRQPPPAAHPDVEFASRTELTKLVDSYCRRRMTTNAAVRAAASLDVACPGHPSQPPRPGLDLRWVLLHLLEETAHHAGHADATRELLDGRRSTA
ncbi:MAG TPA: DUF664 domain-containing protein [Acidimicrobiales bacterium]|nr:DUF664 domain-containing protein [Acidimicrobiales bacterium]